MLLLFISLENVIFLRFCVFCVPDSSPFPHQFHMLSRLTSTVCTWPCVNSRHPTKLLFLYTLLHQNSNIRTYMLARTDMENLVSIILSIVFVFYNILKSNFFPRRICMLLACLQRWMVRSLIGRCHQAKAKV